MSVFRPPMMTGLNSVINYLHQLAPKVGRELERIEKKIPEKGPTMDEILAAVKESPEVKDAVYRYIKDREAKE